MKRIVVTGATGGIGRAVCSALADRGDEVVALSRNESLAKARLGDRVNVIGWPDPTGSPPPENALSGADAVVNLLGERVDQRWTAEAKARIRDSRVRGTRHLVHALRELADHERPAALVSQSAVGIYGAMGDRELDENAATGHDFLAQVVAAWEGEAEGAEPVLRVVRTRTGLALSPGDGALARMLPFFRLGIGGPVASGRHYVPWVHLDDVVRALIFCVDNPQANGPVNLCSPNPVTNSEFSRVLGRVLRRPAVLPVPAAALRLLYGEMAQIVTTGQRVIPRRLEDLGFQFSYPALEPALRAALRARVE